MKKNDCITYEEHRLRSIIKAITYRLTGTITTMCISFIITGKINMAIAIGITELISKIFIYYIHERLWDKIKIGKKVKEIEYNI